MEIKNIEKKCVVRVAFLFLCVCVFFVVVVVVVVFFCCVVFWVFLAWFLNFLKG